MNPGGTLTRLFLTALTTVAQRRMTLSTEPDTGDQYSLLVKDHLGGEFFRAQLTVAGAVRLIAFLGGTGATATTRPGQLIDATTGAAGDTLVATTGLVGVLLTAAINDNFKRCLDRINALEQKVKDAGLFV